VPPERVRVVCPDVGGAFGSRFNIYPEQVVVVWAARRLGRAVKWTGDRHEAFLTDYTARDVVTKARLGFDREGRILALSLELTGNTGAHTVSYVPLSNGYRVAPTVYDVPIAWVRTRAVMTNTVPTAPFRGAGRPEATAVMERLLDIAAKRLQIDRVELRRRNLIPHDKFPHRTATGLNYDSGDFAGNLARVLEMADWDGFAARRKEAKTRGRLRGIAVVNYVETPVGMPHERLAVKVSADKVDLIVGTQSSGQGHETSFAQVVSDLLHVPAESVKIISGDTDVVKVGGGSHSGRSMRHAATVFSKAMPDLIERGKKVAAVVLGEAPDTITYDDGRFGARDTNRTFDFLELAKEAASHALPEALKDGIAVVTDNEMHDPVFPNGTAICEVEVDPDTGTVTIMRYASVDDVGRCINPLIVDGQTHGAIVQGVGQAMWEQCYTDPDSGQPLCGSLMDYGMPRADGVPSFVTEIAEVLSPTNPLGIKAGGEGGTTAAPAVMVSAIVDALSVYGIRNITMPATPYNVWKAIQEAKAARG